MMDLLQCILLVDDNRFLNLLNIDMMKNLSIAKDIHVVKNGYEAMDYLEACDESNSKKYPEIIFLDLVMPEMDGLSFLKNFKKYLNNKESKIIVLSSLVKDEIIPQLHALGVDDIIFKPLKQEVLIEKINKHFPEKKFEFNKKPIVDF